jgi:hypothetical protein
MKILLDNSSGRDICLSNIHILNFIGREMFWSNKQTLNFNATFAFLFLLGVQKSHEMI